MLAKECQELPASSFHKLRRASQGLESFRLSRPYLFCQAPSSSKYSGDNAPKATPQRTGDKASGSYFVLGQSSWVQSGSTRAAAGARCHGRIR